MSNMAEDQAGPVLDPNVNVPPLSITEHLPNDVMFISGLTPPLASSEQQQLWIDPEYGSRIIGNTSDEPLAYPVKASDSLVVKEMDSLFGNELITDKRLQRATGDTQKCGCSLVYGPTNVLNQHVLTHQTEGAHVCNCQRGVKHHEHFTGLQKWKTYCCPELPKLPAVAEHPSTSDYYHSFSLFPPQFSSVFQSDSCGTSYSSYTGFEKLGVSHYPEEPKITLVKPRMGSDVMCLAATGDSHSLENPIDLSTSHDTLASNQWTSDLEVASTMEPESPETKGWESSLDFTWKEVLSVQLCKDDSVTGMHSLPSSGCLKKNQPILPKQNLQHLKPHSKQHVPPMSGTVPSKEPSRDVTSVVHSTATDLRAVPSRQKSKSRKKKILKAANIPSPPLPFPRPATQRRPRPRPGYLISPSQVALESFGKETNIFQTTKEGSGGAMRQKGRGSENRTSLKSPPSCPTKSLPAPPQAPTTSCAEMNHHSLDLTSSTKGVRVDRAEGWSQESQLSPLVMPVSVPVISLQIETQPIVKGLPKKSRPGLPRSLIMPNSQSASSQHHSNLQGQEGRKAGGYPSQLRSPKYLSDYLRSFQPPPYTPPPMLSPVRPGTGLYFNTMPQSQPCLPPPSIFTISQDRKDGITLMTDNTVVCVEPRINVGSRFQAQIPPLRGLLLTLYDEHPAQLVWAPWGDLDTNPETQKKVRGFLDMCCSSVLPGGGTNTELALHCLHEVKGDIIATLDQLLMKGVYRTFSHPLSNYHYAGSDHWSIQEKRIFQKALHNHNKDFQLIRKELQTKSVTQCVEYYYTMKKLKKFKQSHRGTDQTPGTKEYALSESHRTGIRKSLTRPRGTHETQPDANQEYTCVECGRTFHKVKSRSAHMKTHRQQERQWSSMETS